MSTPPPPKSSPVTSGFIHLETFTADNHLIISKSVGDKFFVGRTYEMSPLIGGGGEFGDIVVNIFKAAPDDSVIQVSLVSSPDFNSAERFAQGKQLGNEVISELVERQRKLLIASATIGWQPDIPALNCRTVLISLAIPVDRVDEETLVNAGNLQFEFLTNLKGCGFFDAQPLSAGEVLGVYRQFADIFTPRKTVELDELLDLKLQVFGPDQRFDFSQPDFGQFGDSIFCSAVTAKSYPKSVSHGIMNLLSGAPMNSGTTMEGGGQRISTPFIISTSIRVANQSKEAYRIKKALDSRQAVQTIPFKLGNEDEAEVFQDLKYLQKACSTENDKIVYTALTAFVFGKTREQVVHARTTIKGMMDKLDFDGRVVTNNTLVRWAQALPMNFSPSIANKLACEAVMPASSAACLLAVNGDNLGNALSHTPNTGAAFITRRGCAHFFDPFVSQSNKNGAIFAAAGSGKSFLTQYLINTALAEGTTVILFENGRSSKKLCLAVDGEFNEFSIDSEETPSLNPFSGLSDSDFNEQQENITSLLLLMAYEDGVPEAGARIALSEAVKAAYGQKSSGADINRVIESLTSIEKSGAENSLKNEVVIAAGNLVPRLRAFIESPSRGQFFRGEGTLNAAKQFTVFELGGLMGDNHLRKCVLFFVMNTLMTRIKNIPGRKMIIVDEASDLLKDDGPAAVLSGLYRKGRKDNVGVWIVSQSPRDMANNPAGEVILSQSAWKLVMAQEAEEIDKVVKEGVLTAFANDPYFNRLIKDLQTRKGIFSEVLIMGEKSYEVARLYVDRFTSSLFSSEGEDRDVVFQLMNQGMPAADAVNQVIGDNSKKRRSFISAFIAQLKNFDGLSDKQIMQEIREEL
jgi:conjugal transfer ATP-binding protein TraC